MAAKTIDGRTADARQAERERDGVILRGNILARNGMPNVLFVYDVHHQDFPDSVYGTIKDAAFAAGGKVTVVFEYTDAEKEFFEGIRDRSDEEIRAFAEKANDEHFRQPEAKKLQFARELFRGRECKAVLFDSYDSKLSRNFLEVNKRLIDYKRLTSSMLSGWQSAGPGGVEGEGLKDVAMVQQLATHCALFLTDKVFSEHREEHMMRTIRKEMEEGKGRDQLIVVITGAVHAHTLSRGLRLDGDANVSELHSRFAIYASHINSKIQDRLPDLMEEVQRGAYSELKENMMQETGRDFIKRYLSHIREGLKSSERFVAVALAAYVYLNGTGMLDSAWVSSNRKGRREGYLLMDAIGHMMDSRDTATIGAAMEAMGRIEAACAKFEATGIPEAGEIVEAYYNAFGFTGIEEVGKGMMRTT